MDLKKIMNIKKIIEEKINEIPTITETKIYEETINKCREDIMTGKQLKLNHTEYQLGTSLYATTDIGKAKDGQQDSVIILEHPQNKDFKLIAVSDGVGGSSGGDLASRHIIAKLTEWFENQNPENYNDVYIMENSLNNMLPYIMNDLDAPQEAAATLALTVIGKDRTLIANLGDSKVYSMKNGILRQETKDDSYVQFLHKIGRIPEEELMRYHKESNVIMDSIFMDGENLPNYKIIRNDSYDKIIAVSDGVADCLSPKEIQNLINASKKEYITSNLVEAALTTNSNLQEEINSMPEEKQKRVIKAINDYPYDYYEQIPGGKDNTSAVGFIKR